MTHTRFISMSPPLTSGSCTSLKTFESNTTGVDEEQGLNGEQTRQRKKSCASWICAEFLKGYAVPCVSRWGIAAAHASHPTRHENRGFCGSFGQRRGLCFTGQCCRGSGSPL